MIIVIGIARSGLTVTMQMLEAGGYPCEGHYPEPGTSRKNHCRFYRQVSGRR